IGPDVDPAAAAARDVPLLRVGTLSKALGALGGFVAGPRRYVDLLVNRARPFIFTTAPTPADTAAGLAALRVLRSPEGAALLGRLRRNVDRVRPGHPTPIVPVVVGEEAAAVAAAGALLEQGLLVPAIRPPTVPPGTSRLRVALSAAHTDDQVDRLVAALAALPAAAPPGATDRPSPPAPSREGRGQPSGAARARRRHRHRGRQDLGGVPARPGPAAPGPDRGRAQAGPVLRPRGRPDGDRRRAAGPRRGRPPGPRLPSPPLVPGADGPAHGGRGDRKST